MTQIQTAVFPVAGRGTRFLPATKASPKEMLPIVDKPLIQYAAEEALAAGARKLVFITGSSKRAIEDHFDSDHELEEALEAQGKAELLKALRDIAEFFYRPDEKRYGIAIYTDNSYDAMAMGFENALFSYGGDLGDYETYKVDGFINSDKAVEALDAYKELYKFTPPGWAKTFYVENNQAITEGLAAMSMNYFAFLPSLLNEATNPHAKVTGFFANPPGPYGDQYAALGGQGISVVSYSSKQEESMKFLKWFISDEVQQKWADLGGYTCSAAVLSSEAFRNATPYNEAFYQTMFKVKDFWAVPEYAELLQQLNDRIYPVVVGGETSSKDALDGLAADWKATFAKYGRGG